jgi:fructose-1,6-bisphosphatase/inositol monophosphatase family enzyme
MQKRATSSSSPKASATRSTTSTPAPRAGSSATAKPADIRAALPRWDIERYRDHALKLAHEARQILRAMQRGAFEVKTKDDGSPVTSADLAVEARLRALTLATFPEHGQLGEEFPPHKPEADFRWVFDPVDGTEDFVHRVPTFGCIIGLFYRGEPIVGVIDIPMLEERVHAAYGLGAIRDSVTAGNQRLRLADFDPKTPAMAVRVMSSARANYVRRRQDGARFDALAEEYPNLRIYRSCYMHLCAATGQTDAAVDYGNPLWDIAAARIVVEEAGGEFRVVDSYELDGERMYNSVFGRPALVSKIAKLLRAIKPGKVLPPPPPPKPKREPKPEAPPAPAAAPTVPTERRILLFKPVARPRPALPLKPIPPAKPAGKAKRGRRPILTLSGPKPRPAAKPARPAKRAKAKSKAKAKRR